MIFFAVLGSGLLFTAYSLIHDMNELGTVVTTWTPFLLLGVTLLQVGSSASFAMIFALLIAELS